MHSVMSRGEVADSNEDVMDGRGASKAQPKESGMCVSYDHGYHTDEG